MESRLTKLEEDVAEIKGTLKSFFTKMDNRDDEGEQPAGKGANKSALGPKVAQGRLDRESLAQLCWEGEYAKYQKMVFVSAPNYSLEISLIHSTLHIFIYILMQLAAAQLHASFSRPTYNILNLQKRLPSV